MWSRRLTLLRTVGATEMDAFRMVIVQDLNSSVAAEDGDDGSGESHRLKRQGRSLRSVSLFSVVPVGIQLHRLSSEKTYV